MRWANWVGVAACAAWLSYTPMLHAQCNGAKIGMGPGIELELPLTFMDRAGKPTLDEVHLPNAPADYDFPLGFIDSVEPPNGSARTTASPLRVLFVGNSLTFYHAMPKLFAALAAAGTQRRVVVSLVSMPGGPTGVLWKCTDVQQVIATLPWDAVIVQLRPGLEQIAPALASATQQFHDLIAAHGARPFAWWQYRGHDDAASKAPAYDTLFTAVATQAGMAVVPVPAAWEAVYARDTTLWAGLYNAAGDGHPSAVGSYLLALTFYQALTGQSPVGLPGTAGLATVPARDAQTLQAAVAAVASRTVQPKAQDKPTQAQVGSGRKP